MSHIHSFNFTHMHTHTHTKHTHAYTHTNTHTHTHVYGSHSPLAHRRAAHDLNGTTPTWNGQVRRDIVDVVAGLGQLKAKGLETLGLTTNGITLSKQV